jgi:NO-binding membrane sensor protein with MHYT domain
VVVPWVVLSVAVSAVAVWLEVSRRLPGAMAIGGALVGAGVAALSSWWNRRSVAALRRTP